MTRSTNLRQFCVLYAYSNMSKWKYTWDFLNMLNKNQHGIRTFPNNFNDMKCSSINYLSIHSSHIVASILSWIQFCSIRFLLHFSPFKQFFFVRAINFPLQTDITCNAVKKRLWEPEYYFRFIIKSDSLWKKFVYIITVIVTEREFLPSFVIIMFA